MIVNLKLCIDTVITFKNVYFTYIITVLIFNNQIHKQHLTYILNIIKTI